MTRKMKRPLDANPASELPPCSRFLAWPALAALLAAPSGAWAKASLSADDHDVPVDQTELHLAGPPESYLDKPSGQQSVEFLASNWMPANLQAFSYQGITKRFQADFLPYLSLAYLFSPFSSDFWRDVSLRIGAGYLQVGRTTDMTMDEFNGEIYRQSVNMAMVDLGAQWSPSGLRYKSLAPYLGAGLLPTIAFTTRSIFDDSTSSFSIPIEVSAGVNWGLPDLGLFTGSAKPCINLGVFSTFGSISGSDAASVGFQGGLRFEI